MKTWNITTLTIVPGKNFILHLHYHMFVFTPFPHCFMFLVFYFFFSGPWTTSQDGHHSLWVSLYIYSSMSHHFPNKVDDKAHPSSPELCPVGGVPVTTVFQGHPRVEQKSLHKLCTNFFLSITWDPCTTGMSNRFKWEARVQQWWITWQSALWPLSCLIPPVPLLSHNKLLASLNRMLLDA